MKEDQETKHADKFKIVNMHERKPEDPKAVDMFKGKKVLMDIVPAEDGDFKILFVVEFARFVISDSNDSNLYPSSKYLSYVPC